MLTDAMIKPDQLELLIAAGVGAVIGFVASGQLGSQSLSAGWFIFFRIFDSACPLLVASRRHGGTHHETDGSCGEVMQWP
jgi:hypothetical protein